MVQQHGLNKTSVSVWVFSGFQRKIARLTQLNGSTTWLEQNPLFLLFSLSDIKNLF
eukprot:m.325157 g.325157  ORF g.325157 m.325157 type:complete len:56 (+) comp37238_c0_seq1:58-225(+)